MLLRTDRDYWFPFDAAELWARIARVDEYRTWWPWLHRFIAAGLTRGETWVCLVRPPLPYAVAFTVDLQEIVPERSVRAVISGDIRGTAAVHISAHGPRTRVRIVADLEPDNQLLRALSIAARPIVRLGHDWVLDTGADQFRRRSRDD